MDVVTDMFYWLRDRVVRGLQGAASSAALPAERASAEKPYRRPDDDIAAMYRAFRASSVLRPPD